MAGDVSSQGNAESEVAVTAAAVTDGAYTLFVADFDDTDTAWAAYQELQSLEDGVTVAIDGVVVVKRNADGAVDVQQATDHSTRSGLTWGLVGGVVLGVIFPPPIIGSAAVLGAAGAAGGKVGSATIARNWPNNWRPRSLRGARGSWRWSPIPAR